MVRNHQGNKQPIEPSLVNQTTSKADYTTVKNCFKIIIEVLSVENYLQFCCQQHSIIQFSKFY